MSLTDLAALISPAFIIGGFLVVVARWLWRRFEAQQEVARLKLETFNKALNEALLDRLDTQDKVQQETLKQAQKTNGKVAEHDQQITVLRTETEMLMKLYLKGAPE